MSGEHPTAIRYAVAALLPTLLLACGGEPAREGPSATAPAQGREEPATSGGETGGESAGGAVRAEMRGVHLRTGGGEPSAPVPDRGHMFFRGNRLRFGKLTMHDTDLEIADADPSDPFDFYLDRYRTQLTAGYSKTLEDGGLVSYMPDYPEAADGERVP